MYLRYKIGNEEHISLIRDICIKEEVNEVVVKCDFGITVILYRCIGIDLSEVDANNVFTLIPDYDYEVFHYGDKI